MTKRPLLRAFTASFVTVLSALSLATPLASATAQNCQWTGAAGDNKFSTATNWTNCNSSVPQAGDIIVFNTISANDQQTINLTNDLGVALGGVVAHSDTTGAISTLYMIDTLTLADGATLDTTDNTHNNSSSYTGIDLEHLTAQGDLTLAGSVGFSWSGSFSSIVSISGVLTLTDGASFDGNGVGANGVIVQNGSALTFAPSTTNATTPNYPITLGGGSGTDNPMLSFNAYYDSSADTQVPTTWTFANPITLLHDADVFTSSNVTVNQTGSISGAGYALLMSPDSLQGSSVNFNPSSDNSNTTHGIQNGTAENSGGTGHDDVSANANGTVPDTAKTPDTGFALVAAHPVQILAITALLAAGIFIASRRVLAKAAVRR